MELNKINVLNKKGDLLLFEEERVLQGERYVAGLNRLIRITSLGTILTSWSIDVKEVQLVAKNFMRKSTQSFGEDICNLLWR